MTRYEQLDNLARRFYKMIHRVSNDDMKVIWLKKYFEVLDIIENSTIEELSQTVN